jgi:hypothetical protein
MAASCALLCASVPLRAAAGQDPHHWLAGPDLFGRRGAVRDTSAGTAQLGYVEGKNIAFEYRSADKSGIDLPPWPMSWWLKVDGHAPAGNEAGAKIFQDDPDRGLRERA